MGEALGVDKILIPKAVLKERGDRAYSHEKLKFTA